MVFDLACTRWGGDLQGGRRLDDIYRRGAASRERCANLQRRPWRAACGCNAGRMTGLRAGHDAAGCRPPEPAEAAGDQTDDGMMPRDLDARESRAPLREKALA